MGRTSDEEGESSTQACDVEDSDERPLKKARYIWQIKGKYHLKKPDDEEKDRMKDSLSGSTSPVNEVDGFATLTSEVECSKTHLEEEKEPVLMPTVVENVQNTEQESEVVSLGTTSAVQELARVFSMWELRKWQDRQLARSFVDNTINKVIETMGFVPLPNDAADISDEEFLSPSIDTDDEDVEDEAVLMAIHSHGLQRSEQEVQDPCLEQCCIENEMSIVPCMCNQQPSGSMENQHPYPFHQRPVLSHIADPDQPCECETSPSQNQEAVLPVSTTDSVLNMYPASAVVRNHFESSNDESPEEVHIHPLESSLVMKTQTTSDVFNSTTTQLQPIKDDTNSSYFEHNDFLDQAVGVAIQKKGLSTLSCLEFG